MTWMFTKLNFLFRRLFSRRGTNHLSEFSRGFDSMGGNHSRLAMNNFLAEMRHTVLQETGRSRLTIGELKYLRRLAIRRWPSLPEELKAKYRMPVVEDSNDAPQVSQSTSEALPGPSVSRRRRPHTQPTGSMCGPTTRSKTRRQQAQLQAAKTDARPRSESTEGQGPKTKSRTRRRRKNSVCPPTIEVQPMEVEENENCKTRTGSRKVNHSSRKRSKGTNKSCISKPRIRSRINIRPRYSEQPTECHDGGEGSSQSMPTFTRHYFQQPSIRHHSHIYHTLNTNRVAGRIKCARLHKSQRKVKFQRNNSESRSDNNFCTETPMECKEESDIDAPMLEINDDSLSPPPLKRRRLAANTEAEGPAVATEFLESLSIEDERRRIKMENLKADHANQKKRKRKFHN